MITKLNLEKSDISKGSDGFVYDKITANQYAKEHLFSQLEAAFYFQENDDKLTDKEAEEIRIMMIKRMEGIRKYLGL